MDIDNRNFDIVARTLAGETLQSIGDNYGITRERVRQILLGKGITYRAWKTQAAAKRLAKETIKREREAAIKARNERVAAEYRSGESCLTLAAKYDVGYGTILNWIRATNTKIRPLIGKRPPSYGKRIAAGHARRKQNENKQGAMI